MFLPNETVMFADSNYSKVIRQNVTDRMNRYVRSTYRSVWPFLFGILFLCPFSQFFICFLFPFHVHSHPPVDRRATPTWPRFADALKAEQKEKEDPLASIVGGSTRSLAIVPFCHIAFPHFPSFLPTNHCQFAISNVRTPQSMSKGEVVYRRNACYTIRTLLYLHTRYMRTGRTATKKIGQT